MGCGSSSDKHSVQQPTAQANNNNSAGKQQFPGIPDGAQQAANKNFGLTNHTIVKVLLLTSVTSRFAFPSTNS